MSTGCWPAYGKQEYYTKAKRALVIYTRGARRLGWWLGDRVETGVWSDPTAGIMGGIDSYYEYLLKASILSAIRTGADGRTARPPSINILADRHFEGFGMGRRI